MARCLPTAALLMLLFFVVDGAAVFSGVTRCNSREDCRDPGDGPDTVAVCVANVCYKTRQAGKKTENVLRNDEEKTAHFCTVIRDFRESHADMESVITDVNVGMVDDTLGSDGTPVLSEHGKSLISKFGDWFHDTENTLKFETTESYTWTPPQTTHNIIVLSQNFPIDDQGYGNEGNSHNYHFTEHKKIIARAYTDEDCKITASSDDDLWIYRNGTLVIDIGGVHERPNFPTIASWGCNKGDAFEFDVFYAERHTVEAKLFITTEHLEPLDGCDGYSGQCCGASCCSGDITSYSSSEMPSFTADSQCDDAECATDEDCAALIYDDACSCAFCCNGVCDTMLNRCDDGDDTTRDVCAGDGTICEHYPILDLYKGELSPCQYTRWTTIGACMTHTWLSQCTEPRTLETVHEIDCDDGDPTTDDTCVDGVCSHMSNECHECACDCNDGNACTVDTCDPETMCCIHTQLLCDDGNKCTIDFCNHFSGGCQHVPKNCDDGNKCTSETCDGETGECVYTRKDCSDSDPCTLDLCDALAGECSNPPKCTNPDLCHLAQCHDEGLHTGECYYTPTDCSDLDGPCTVGVCNLLNGVCEPESVVCPPRGHCVEGECDYNTGKCEYWAKNCSDGFNCTVDSCDDDTGLCVNAPKCPGDEHLCTHNWCEEVDGGTCMVTEVECQDASPCNTSTCNERTGECEFSLVDCDDDDWCTDDACDEQTGNCLNVPNYFDDDNCTQDICDPQSGRITHPQIDCDDGKPFTEDYCEDGECKHRYTECEEQPNPCQIVEYDEHTGACILVDKDCSHKSECINGTCNLRTGECEYERTNCDDGNNCTVDSCDDNTGVCVHTAIVCDDHENKCVTGKCNQSTGECDYDRTDCDDGHFCTDDSCDPATGHCVYDEHECDHHESNFCIDEVCWENSTHPWIGECQYTRLVHCETGVECLIGECDPATGDCVYSELDCDDKKLCTLDFCNNKTGCYHELVVCEYDDPCFPKVCHPDTGQCVEEPILCDDGNTHTSDECVDGVCVYTHIPCDDQDSCTVDILDLGGKCLHLPKDCDDKNPCTTDMCRNDTGDCLHIPKMCPEFFPQPPGDGDIDARDILELRDPEFFCPPGGQAGCGPWPWWSKCWIHYCHEGTGECARNKIDCDDKIESTYDWCNHFTGKCEHLTHPCDDQDPCTDDYLDPLDGRCKHPEKNCADGNLCTRDECNRETGECMHFPKVCDDGNNCTYNICDPNTGHCSYPPIDCDDRNWCTNDFCNRSNGDCYHKAVLCFDQNPCTSDVCHPSTGECMHPDIDCDDNDWCTNDFCNATGSGCHHRAIVYTDDLECWESHCNQATGERVAEMLPDGTRCNITDPCTHYECFNGECLAREELDCRPRPRPDIVLVIIVSMLGLLALIVLLLFPVGAPARGRRQMVVVGT